MSNILIYMPPSNISCSEFIIIGQEYRISMYSILPENDYNGETEFGIPISSYETIWIPESHFITIEEHRILTINRIIDG